MSLKGAPPTGRTRPGAGPPSFAVWALVLALSFVPRGVSGQLARPCRSACGLVLGATAVTTATGAAVAAGRLSGGISTVRDGLVVWGATLGLFVGAGLSLGGNGDRQERAVYGAGIGTLVGPLVWLGVGSATGGGSSADKVAAALVGAAVGAVVGGIYGATTFDASSEPSPPTGISVSLSLW